MSIFRPSHGIAFDIDGIVLDTATHIWKAVMEHLNQDWPLDMWAYYDIEHVVGVPTVELRPFYEPVLEREDLPMVEGAGAVLQWLHAQFPEEELLFITSRRPQFKDSAVASIRKGIGPKIPFKVVCTTETDKEFEYRNDKLATLQEHGIEFYMEDNPMYWTKYMDNNITIATLHWPWTIGDYKKLQFKYDNLLMFPKWRHLLTYFEVMGLSWKDRHKC